MCAAFAMMATGLFSLMLALSGTLEVSKQGQ
jgi:hypothetical protein